MSEWIPLLQTLAWVGLIVVILVLGRRNWGGIMRSIERRISQGDEMRLKVFGISGLLRRAATGLPRLESADDVEPQALTISESKDLTDIRERLGKDQRGVHLVHVVAPSDKPGQRYDIYAYLYGWGRGRFGNPEDLSDVVRAEFFLGPEFNPSGVAVENDGSGRMGFSTSAHAPAICLCKVTFNDGHEALLSRYLDFASADLALEAIAPTS
ncbi:pYEATS domain-containing protein [Agromyces sp. NPDC058484]|uniref:pYEATS domain-containing protein n=1 Tax=Agromyces sp. NPDC058484 TaxID=3346524 RepID=UPI00365B739B